MMDSILATAMMVGVMRLILAVDKIATILMMAMKMEAAKKKIAMLMSMMSWSKELGRLA